MNLPLHFFTYYIIVLMRALFCNNLEPNFWRIFATEWVNFCQKFLTMRSRSTEWWLLIDWLTADRQNCSFWIRWWETYGKYNQIYDDRTELDNKYKFGCDRGIALKKSIKCRLKLACVSKASFWKLTIFHKNAFRLHFWSQNHVDCSL